MIKYSLKCNHNHIFEAWFPNSDDYEVQKLRGLLSCPMCGSKEINKAPMSPAIAKINGAASLAKENAVANTLPHSLGGENDTNLIPKELREVYADIKSRIEKDFDYVGDAFAKEARDIHDGIAQERPIYGETNAKEARELLEDGINIAPIPTLMNPKADKKLN